MVPQAQGAVAHVMCAPQWSLCVCPWRTPRGPLHVCTGHCAESDFGVIENSGSACSDVATITAALNNAKMGGWQFKSTHVPGPMADAAIALRDALDTFAKMSVDSTCDVCEMKWGMKYHDSVSGFTVARALVAEICFM